MDASEYLSRKSAITFDFLNIGKKDVLLLEDMLYFPKELLRKGKQADGEKLKELYTEYFSRLCASVGKGDPDLGLTKPEFICGNDILRKTDWYSKVFMDNITDIYFDSVDTDGSGKISFKEWRALYYTRGIRDESFIESTFAKMDSNKNGTIERSEFKHAFLHFGISEDQNEDFSFLYDRQNTA